MKTKMKNDGLWGSCPYCGAWQSCVEGWTRGGGVAFNGLCAVCHGGYAWDGELGPLMKSTPEATELMHKHLDGQPKVSESDRALEMDDGEMVGKGAACDDPFSCAKVRTSGGINEQLIANEIAALTHFSAPLTEEKLRQAFVAASQYGASWIDCPPRKVPESLVNPIHEGQYEFSIQTMFENLLYHDEPMILSEVDLSDDLVFLDMDWDSEAGKDPAGDPEHYDPENPCCEHPGEEPERSEEAGVGDAPILAYCDDAPVQLDEPIFLNFTRHPAGPK
jgi:hypothetical protein